MLSSRFVAATVFAILLQSQGAVAQMAMPAEFPPSSFAGNQFIDSDGCVFVRATIGGVSSWVPRLTRDRRQLCGFQPTQVAGATAAPPPVPLPANAPIINIPSAPVVTATAPASALSTLPAPVTPRRTSAQPITTVASTTTAPTIGRSAAQAATPIAAPAVSPRIEVAPAAPRATLTRAQACEGKTGIQPGLVSSRTGQPIDCGPAAPVQVAVAAPAVTIAPSSVSAPVNPSRTISFVELCADMSATGRRYVNARTGADVRCGPQTQALSAQTMAPQAPSRPVGPAAIAAPGATPVAIAAPVVRVAAPVAAQAAPQPTNLAAPSAGCPGFDAVAARYMAAGAQAVRCGPQTQSPSAAATGQSSGATSNKFQNPFAAQIPASNPPAGTASPTRPPRGYKAVWDDGRINPNRGLPRVQAAQPQVQISSRTAPQPQVQATSHRYVQVGTFGSGANAQAAVARLQALGLPVGIGSVTRNGQVLQVVAAGPFGSVQALQSALGQARAAGFGDAFTRR